jgi:two-component system, chemotaxis family, protein-glutamate methylesterase/glutaminase
MDAFTLPKCVDILLVGTSAGGVEALSMLLPALRRSARSSGFIVMHRMRDQGSLLPGVLSTRCASSVIEAEDKCPVRPGTIYIAPADYHLLIDPGPAIALSVDAEVRYSRPSIDVLFESAARLYQERVLAIILTGANNDGALGLQSVRKKGGLTAVQDPTTAQSAAMPAAALRAGPVDYVLGLSDLQRLIAALP